MNKFASMCVALAFLMMAAPVFAGDAPATTTQAAPAAAPALEGTVSAVDAKAMSVTVKDAKGTEKTIFWNADTKVTLKDGKAGKSEDLKAGATVSAQTAEKEGKLVASEIAIK